MKRPVVHRLIVLDGPHPREVIPRSEPLPIGRAPDKAIVLHHQTVSRQHATIWKTGEDVFIQDSGSTFGTLLNDQRLPSGEPVRLKDGDILQLGQIQVLCRFEPEMADKKAAARDAAFAAQANARILLLDGERIRRRPLARAVTLIGSARHCDVQLEDPEGPPEQALIRAVDGRYVLEPRSKMVPPLLNEKEIPVVEVIPLETNSALLLKGAQLLFLYDFDAAGRPVTDFLEAFPRTRLLAHISRQCGFSRLSLKRLFRGRRVTGQQFGEILVAKGMVTPLFWRVLCVRLQDSCRTRSAKCPDLNGRI